MWETFLGPMDADQNLKSNKQCRTIPLNPMDLNVLKAVPYVLWTMKYKFCVTMTFWWWLSFRALGISVDPRHLSGYYLSESSEVPYWILEIYKVAFSCLIYSNVCRLASLFFSLQGAFVCIYWQAPLKLGHCVGILSLTTGTKGIGMLVSWTQTRVFFVPACSESTSRHFWQVVKARMEAYFYHISILFLCSPF